MLTNIIKCNILILKLIFCMFTCNKKMYILRLLLVVYSLHHWTNDLSDSYLFAYYILYFFNDLIWSKKCIIVSEKRGYGKWSKK